jgi:hypothetical protein
VQYPILCGSNQPFGFVAYNGPGIAARGATVYYCMSNGKRLITPPKKIPPRKRRSGDQGGDQGGGGHGPPGHHHHFAPGPDVIFAREL